MKEKTREQEDAVLRRMLSTPHSPNLPKPKRTAKKAVSKPRKAKKPSK